MRISPLAVAAFVASCGPAELYAPTPAPASPSTDSPQPSQPTSATPPTCGGMEFALERVPPNVLLVLDRSGSMGQPISDFSFTSKFDDLQMALVGLVSTIGSQVRLGLDLFPDPLGGNCVGGGIAIQPGAGTGMQLLSLVSQAGLDQSTPTAATLDNVLRSGAVADPTRSNYVVLATDGQPTCGDQDVTSRINALFAATPSVKTFVIGVGGETASNPDLLNQWAVAGRTARTGAVKYYQSNSPTDLQMAFAQIAGGLASCTFKMAQAAPDPKQLYVWSNGTQVAADAAAGYTYDATGPSVTLHGAACDLLQKNPATKIQVVFGCAAAPIQ